MTREKLQFLLPVVFTVGPDVNQRGAAAGQAPRNAHGVEDSPEDRGDALTKYAMLLAEGENKKNLTRGQHIDNIVKGIIEGETRVLVSSMTMEEIFTERDEFKKRIFRNIQEELAQFGLKIYNANVKELRDAPQSSYFESLSRKAHEGAINQARIDVAEAQRRGNVGEAQRQGEQNREIAKINAETAVCTPSTMLGNKMITLLRSKKPSVTPSVHRLKQLLRLAKLSSTVTLALLKLRPLVPLNRETRS
jgi:flotillin